MKISNLPFSAEKRFCAVRDKRPLEPEWQKGNTLTHCKSLLSSTANGIGLITGNGLLAIDFDGENAYKIANAIGSWLILDDTLMWSSGKPHRHQRLYQIPQQHLKLWHGITKKNINNYGDITAIATEQLEIRYGNCQSVLPPSVHPQTGKYEWLNDLPVRELTLQQSNQLITIITQMETNQQLTSEQELQLVESALSVIPSDDYNVWLTVGMALHDGGYDLSLWDKWSSTAVNYQSGCCDKKWSTFKKSGIGLGSLFKLASDYGFEQRQWMRDNLKSNVTRLNDTVKDKVRATNELPNLINQLIDKLSNTNLTDDYRSTEIAKFSALHKVSSASLEKALKARLSQSFKQEAIDYLDLDTLIKHSKQALDLDYILGEYLAELIRELAKSIPTAPEAVLTIMLPMIASVIGTRSIIYVKPHYTQPFILRTMLIANSGQKKTPVAEATISPMRKLDTLNQKRLMKELAEWHSIPNNKEPMPTCRRYIVQDSTIDGLIREHSENRIGLLNFVDELAGYFNRMNKFAKGDDVQRDLEMYNGKTLIKSRANKENSIFLEQTAISATGTIQWNTLENLGMIDADDSMGVFARWLPCAVELPKGYFNPDDIATDYYDVMLHIITSIRDYDIPEELRLSRDALLRFADWQHGIIDATDKQQTNKIKLKYSKIEGEVIRLAGILHFIHQVMGSDDELISLDTMNKAIMLADWFLSQYVYVTMRCDNQLIDSKLLKAMQIIERKGVITASQLFNYNRSAFSSVEDTADILTTLITMGKVKRIDTKKGLKVTI